MRRRGTIMLMGATLALAACGSTEGDTPTAAEPATITAGTTAPSTATEPGDAGDPGEATPNSTDPDTDPTGTDPTGTTGSTDPADTDPAGTTASTGAVPGTDSGAAPATSAPATPPPTETRADDGCSPDNSPTETDVADGPVPSIEVRAASAGNTLPDLAVRRVNCGGGWVNLKNEVPADLPLLVWFWAPH